MNCKWCGREFDAEKIIKYKDDYFCDETCLGQYLVDQEEIEVEWHDTPENMRICAEESRYDY